MVGGEKLDKLGDGGYDFGARARQIRDNLFALDKASEQDLLAIQLDDRALFMGTWRDFFLDTIEDESIRSVIENEWTGRASTDSAGYRIVRELRLAVHEAVLSSITRKVRAADPRFDIWAQRQWEGPVWKLVTEQPAHLLPSSYDSWNAWIKAIVDQTVAEWDEPLETRTWGDARMSDIRHPLSRAVPFLSRWLDMPSRPLPGDRPHAPRPKPNPRRLGAIRSVTGPRRRGPVPHARRPKRPPALPVLRRRPRRLGGGPTHTASARTHRLHAHVEMTNQQRIWTCPFHKLKLYEDWQTSGASAIIKCWRPALNRSAC